MKVLRCVDTGQRALLTLALGRASVRLSSPARRPWAREPRKRRQDPDSVRGKSAGRVIMDARPAALVWVAMRAWPPPGYPSDSSPAEGGGQNSARVGTPASPALSASVQPPSVLSSTTGLWSSTLTAATVSWAPPWSRKGGRECRWM